MDPKIREVTARMRAGDHAGAITIIDGMLRERPDVALTWRARGECLAAMGYYDDAVTSFREALRRGGPGLEDVPLHCAIALFNNARVNEAIRWLEVLLEMEPSAEIRASAERMLASFRR